MFRKYISSFSRNISLKVLITINLLLMISSFAQAEKVIEPSKQELHLEDTEEYAPPPGTTIPRGTQITADISVSIFCEELEIRNSRTGVVVSSVWALKLGSKPFSFWTYLESGNYTVKEKYELVIEGKSPGVLPKELKRNISKVWSFPNAISGSVTFEISSWVDNARVTTSLYVKIINPDPSSDAEILKKVKFQDLTPISMDWLKNLFGFK